jgi:hypothetical protein
VNLRAADPDAVVPPVVLLFHEKEELMETPEGILVSVDVMLQRFAQPHESHATLVLDEIAHELVRGR